MSNLPEYLRMRVNAAPNPKNTVTLGNVRITVITPHLIRIEQGAFTDDATTVVLCRNFCQAEYCNYSSERGIHISTGYLTLDYKAGHPLETLTIRAHYHPAFTWHYGQKPLQNLKGTTSTLDCVDGACPLDDGVCSIDGYAVLDDSASLRMTADGWFAPRERCTDVYFFGYGHDYTEAVRDFQRLTGGPAMLPAFALGNWWSRYHAYTDREYLELMDRFRDEDIPFSVGVVDMDWHVTKIPEELKYADPMLSRGWTGYSWNKELFPDYRAFLKQLHDRNLRTALNLHPAVGTCCHEDMYEQMAVANGIDPATKQRVPLDILSQKHMASYFDILHHPYEDDGVDFWWMDWQQGTNYWWIHDKNNPGEYKDPRERVSPLWLLNHLHILDIQRTGKRPMFFSRYSGPGSHRYPVGFSGDTTISWDSLHFQPEFTATASNIGYSWWSHDIGGHMFGVHDHELYIRWLQLGVFSPINRLHSSNNPYLVKEPWNYPDHVADIARSWLRMRHELFPYIYTMNYRNHSQLLPLVQPMYYSHPKCHEAYKVPNQFWFGSELMVAPITKPNDRNSGLGMADVWLPRGCWFDFFSGIRYDGLIGRRMEIYRRLEQMPIFAKSGALVPLAQYEPHSNNLVNAKRIQLLVFPGASNSFTLYEDRGEGNDYSEGCFATTKIELVWGDVAKLTIHAAQGDLSLIPSRRSWRIGLRGFHRDIETPGYDHEYDENTNTIWIEVAADVTEPIHISISGISLTHDNSDWKKRCDDIIRKCQLTPDEKDRLWNSLYIDRSRGDKAVRRCVLQLRKNGSVVGKALTELVTLTEDAFIGK